MLAFPVLAAGIAAYLGSNTGAGPAEAAALAWDPPVPFRWSYGLVQGGGALGGYLLGATIGVGTVAVIVALGPLVDLTEPAAAARRPPDLTVVGRGSRASDCHETPEVS